MDTNKRKNVLPRESETREVLPELHNSHTLSPLSSVEACESSDETIGAIIIAAGDRQRNSGIDKMWAPLAGQPLISWTIEAFEQTIPVHNIIVVIPTDHLAMGEKLRETMRWRRVLMAPTDGKGVRDVVLCGLRALPQACNLVIIHDGARPLIEPELILAGLDHAKINGSAIASIPVQETLKHTDNGIVIRTPLRSALALLQTPQVFQRHQLENACLATNPSDNSLDAATLANATGIPLSVYPGSVENILVTTPADRALAESLLLRRKQLQGGKRSR